MQITDISDLRERLKGGRALKKGKSVKKGGVSVISSKVWRRIPLSDIKKVYINRKLSSRAV
jgi:hypothetical protein